jgi:hypothetical protein
VFLISGLTMRDLYKYVEHGSISGLYSYPVVSTHDLSRFKHKWGSSPTRFNWPTQDAMITGRDI